MFRTSIVKIFELCLLQCKLFSQDSKCSMKSVSFSLPTEGDVSYAKNPLKSSVKSPSIASRLLIGLDFCDT